MRLGVFLPNWIGDVVMATPALRALHTMVGAGGAMVGVMRPYVAEALGGTTWIDEAILYEKNAKKISGVANDASAGPVAGAAKVYDWREASAALRAAKLDAVVLLTNSLRTGWMAYRSGVRQRIGTAGNLRSALLTTKVYPPRRGWRAAPVPTVAGYLQVAQAAGAPPVAPTLELATTQADERLADDVWRRLGLPAERRVAVMNTGGAFGAAKDWPAEHFAELARRLARQQGLHVLLNCGPKERAAAQGIVDAVGLPQVVSLAGEAELPLGLTKAVIRRARLLVTTDSGPRFFGVAFGVPTVTLFGPTGVEMTRTHGGLETPLSLGLACQPCMERTCPLKHHRCMKDLGVERVYAAAMSALGAKPQAAAA